MISCVAAVVCCVEAETWSVETDERSATSATVTMSLRTRSLPSATSSMAAAIWATRSAISSTAASMRSKDARAASTAVTPCSPTSLPASTASMARRVWAWTSLDQRADGGGGAAGLLGELAHLVGDDGEAAPVLAGAGRLDGGVEGQQVGLLGDAGDGVDDRADLLGLRAELADGLGGAAGGRAQAAHRLRRGRHRGRAVAGERAGLLGAALRRGHLVGRGARGAGHLLGQRARALDGVDLLARAARHALHRGGDLLDGAAGLLGGLRPSAARRRPAAWPSPTAGRRARAAGRPWSRRRCRRRRARSAACGCDGEVAARRCARRRRRPRAGRRPCARRPGRAPRSRRGCARRGPARGRPRRSRRR